MNKMRFKGKGQIDIKVIFLLVIVLVIMGVLSYFSMNQFFQQPLSYPQAWKRWADEAFKSQDQPWRMLGLFFLPFVFYFSVNYLAMSITYLGASRIYGKSELSYVYKPVLLICFTVSMLMLPSPITFGLSGWFMGLSGMLPIFVIIFIALGLPLTFIFIYAMAQQVRSRLPYIPKRKEEKEEAVKKPTITKPTRIEMPEPPKTPRLELTSDVDAIFRNYRAKLVKVIQIIIDIR
ncbi:MAG: hypothetical protein ACTSX6_05390 [Candidatus Heimdallarchaeaceae archaeon]